MMTPSPMPNPKAAPTSSSRKLFLSSKSLAFELIHGPCEIVDNCLVGPRRSSELGVGNCSAVLPDDAVVHARRWDFKDQNEGKYTLTIGGIAFSAFSGGPHNFAAAAGSKIEWGSMAYWDSWDS